MYNMISRSFDKDKLKLELKDNHIDINLTGAIHRKFNLPFLDVSNNDITIPDIKFDSEIIVNAYFLKEILKDVSLIGTTLLFKILDNKFIVEAEGDKGKIETVLPKVKIKSKKNVSVKYSLSYLKNITKSIDNDTNILLKLADDSPLYLEYDIDDKVKVKFYLSSMLI